MPQHFTDEKSYMVQVMACAARHQAITWANIDRDLRRHYAETSQPIINGET